MKFLHRKVTSSDIVAKNQSRAAKKVVRKAVVLSIDDQNAMLHKANLI
jgi:hypothetical protein